MFTRIVQAKSLFLLLGFVLKSFAFEIDFITDQASSMQKLLLIISLSNELCNIIPPGAVKTSAYAAVSVDWRFSLV